MGNKGETTRIALFYFLLYLARSNIFLRKIGAIFLLLVMLLCGSGFYISWRISMRFIYNSQKNLISSATYKKQNVIAFTFSKKDLQNSNNIQLNNDELKYNHKMYDIINMKTSGDKIFINCIADKDEDNLVKIVTANVFATGNDMAKQLPVSHFHIDDYISDAGNLGLFVTNNEIRNNYISITDGILPDQFLSRPSPPPRTL